MFESATDQSIPYLQWSNEFRTDNRTTSICETSLGEFLIRTGRAIVLILAIKDTNGLLDGVNFHLQFM